MIFFSLQNGQEAIKCRVIPVGRIHPEKEYFYFFMSQLKIFSDSIDTHKALASVFFPTNGKIWIYQEKTHRLKNKKPGKKEKKELELR